MDGARTPVLIYTASWCRACEVAKRYLARKGVAFEEIDVESVPRSSDQVTFWTSFKTVPTFRIGETIVRGWDKQALNDALAASADADASSLAGADRRH